MLLTRWTCIIIFVILINHQVEPVGLPIYWAVFNIMDLVVGKTKHSFKTHKGPKLFGSVTNDLLNGLMAQVDEISTKLDVMNNRIMGKLNNIEILIKSVANDMQKDALLGKVVDPMKEVKSRYDELHKLAMMEDPPERRLQTLIEEVTNPGQNGLEAQLKKIHKAMVVKVGVNTKDLLHIMAISAHSDTKERCGSGSSPQHTFYSLYLSIVASELLGFTTITYSHKLLDKNETNPETEKEIKFLSDAIKERLKDYSTLFSEVIKNIPQDIRTCDPVGNHVRDETFIEMWGLYQGILLYEYDLIGSDTCSYKCYNLNAPREGMTSCWTTQQRRTTYINEKPKEIRECTTPRKCFGKLHNCKTLLITKYCALENNTRRYEWVRDTETQYGSVGDCSGIEGRLNLEWSGLYGCDPCFCVCNDNEADSVSVHTISLKESVSDTKNNKIVVGVRFQVHENILHLQVKQSKIIEQYQIEADKVEWVELPEMKEDVFMAHKHPQNSSNRLVRNRDFVAWDWDDSVFNIDYIKCEYGRVMTGVKFELSKKREKFDGHVEVQIQSMEYDINTGKLKTDTARWEKSPKIHKSGSSYERKLPTKSKEKTIIDVEDDQYIFLDKSDWYEDAAQTVLPLFDAQTVEAIPSAPLTGLGFHHRGTLNEAGFFGLTIFSINFGEYIENVRDSGPSDFANSTKLEEPE